MDQNHTAKPPRPCAFNPVGDQPSCGFASKTVEVDAFLGFGIGTSEREQLCVTDAPGRTEPRLSGLGEAKG